MFVGLSPQTWALPEWAQEQTWQVGEDVSGWLLGLSRCLRLQVGLSLFIVVCTRGLQLQALRPSLEQGFPSMCKGDCVGDSLVHGGELLSIVESLTVFQAV